MNGILYPKDRTLEHLSTAMFLKPFQPTADEVAKTIQFIIKLAEERRSYRHMLAAFSQQLADIGTERGDKMDNEFERDIRQQFPNLNIQLKWAGTLFPVRVEGVVNGKNLYFRAKHEHWECIITDETYENGKFPIVSLREYEGEFAGFMPMQRVSRAIVLAIRTFQALEQFSATASTDAFYIEKLQEQTRSLAEWDKLEAEFLQTHSDSPQAAEERDS